LTGDSVTTERQQQIAVSRDTDGSALFLDHDCTEPILVDRELSISGTSLVSAVAVINDQ
jgi:hypothetical protein